MSIEFPYDLINRIQNTLRREANSSSYNPEDSSLPNLPSLEQSISELETSSPSLRCKKCNFSLLVGSQSLVCAFCGLNQRQELPLDPIKFTSSCGFNWFLKFLELNESEMVEPPVIPIKSRWVKNTLREKVMLSDLIALEIKWSAGPEIPETSNKGLLHRANSVLNNQNNSSNNNVLQRQENVNLENVDPIDTAEGSTAGSTEDENEDGDENPEDAASPATSNTKELQTSDNQLNDSNSEKVNRIEDEELQTSGDKVPVRPISKQNELTGGNDTEPEASFSDRMAETVAKDRWNAVSFAESGDVANATKIPKADYAQILI